MSASDSYRKNIQIKSKWSDSITKDNKNCGIGTVTNQIHFPNGAKEEHPFEDRSFAYEFKENEIYAYGLLDGYNGTWAVDIVDQCILTNIYFDRIFELQTMTDQEILQVLNDEFNQAETTLQDNQQEILLERASIAIESADLKKGTLQYVSLKKKKDSLDKELDSGLFAMIALVVDKRLFVTNVGTSHCFLFRYNEASNEKDVVSVETEHKVKNRLEFNRLFKLNATLDNPEQMTRCLGDFKLKLYYDEDSQFKNCTGPPIICKPSHPIASIKIDESVLFMAMYTDGLAKVIEEIDMKGQNTDAKLAKIVIDKIINEQSLNSAAQAVLDEIKRAFDEKFASKFSQREDLTLIVRVFDPSIKTKLSAIQKRNSPSSAVNETVSNSLFQSMANDPYFDDSEESSSEDETLTITRMISETNASETSRRENSEFVKKEISDFLDENNFVIPYIDLKGEFDKLLLDEENKNLFTEFEEALSQLEN